MDKINELKNKALVLTTSPGVYLMKNSKQNIIYIGKAKNLKNRVSSYFRNFNNHNEKIKKMVENIYEFDFIVTTSEFEALVLECSLIKQHKPKYNILLKDSKGYKYIKISDEEFPRISVCTKKTNDNSRYIGPYVSSFSVKEAVEEVNKVFMLPNCKKKLTNKNIYKRPCLNYYIKQCMGPCCNNIKKEEYIKTINEAIDYIKHGNLVSIKYMKQEMQKAAEKEDFESAIKFRDKIKAIEKINQTQKVYLNIDLNADVIAFDMLENKVCFVIIKFKNGRIKDKEDYIFENNMGIENIKEEFLSSYYYKKEKIPDNILLNFELYDINLYIDYIKEQAKHHVEVKTPKKGIFKQITDMAFSNAREILNLDNKEPFKENKTLKQLKNILKLDKIPNYIECYDISNLGDSGIVGAMVVFKNGLPYKKNYRKFKIKTVNTRDDYASMKEVIYRRIKEYRNQKDDSFKNLPDLIFIDGGASHINSVKDIFEKENFKVPFFGLVKDLKHKTKGISSTKGEVNLDLQRDVFLFISKIQDETHRFTISYQKNLRKQNNLKISLTQIKGIGKKTALKILNNFSNMGEIKKSSPKEIAKIANISCKKGENIIKFLNNY